MPKQVKISVVIPTLNEGKYIEGTLFHIAKQKPHEIIIADAHSEDATVKTAKKYGCRVVYSKRGAASYGRNAGAKAATGDVLLFLDADTIVFPNLLEIIKRDFRKDSELAGWTCLIYGFSPSWKEQILYNMSNNIIEFLTKYMKKPHAPGIVTAVRKGVFERVGGFNENMRVMEDHDLALRVGKQGHFMFSKDTCVFTSTRRMNKWGGRGIIKKYSKIYLSYLLRRKNFYKKAHMVDYEVIR